MMARIMHQLYIAAGGHTAGRTVDGAGGGDAGGFALDATPTQPTPGSGGLLSSSEGPEHQAQAGADGVGVVSTREMENSSTARASSPATRSCRRCPTALKGKRLTKGGPW